ncbi:MAG TPA: hypothetical protein DEG17_20510 [Cyanobacteria bacterium UBA11149]|nr:hypothetical protein [Cyanobacteria bacterium UBA11367]HBW91178.1 hypothetical protein [Cyanobacteria bacterium UBA11149]
MEQVLTLVVRLDVSEDQYRLFADISSAFASACNWIDETVNPNLTNRNSIQAVCYRDVKTKFGLTSNHIVRACARVGSKRLTAKQKGKKVKGFKPTSFDYDARTFRFKPISKTEPRRTNYWAFYQLKTSLEYKGIKEGVKVITVNPSYTSQTCHCSWHIGIRTNKKFKWSNKVCGWIGDGDENGSQMIALLGLSVNQPRGSELYVLRH